MKMISNVNIPIMDMNFLNLALYSCFIFVEFVVTSIRELFQSGRTDNNTKFEHELYNLNMLLIKK